MGSYAIVVDDDGIYQKVPFLFYDGCGDGSPLFALILPGQSVVSVGEDEGPTGYGGGFADYPIVIKDI